MAVQQAAALQQCRSLALAATTELEGWLFLQQCLSMKNMRGRSGVRAPLTCHSLTHVDVQLLVVLGTVVNRKKVKIQ